MKTRIIKTKFWQDSAILQLSPDARYLFVYLISCPYIGLTGYFELPDNYILLETGLTSTVLRKAKEELVACRRVFFCDGWVYISNAEKHNRYFASIKIQKAYREELANIPTPITERINGISDSTPLVVSGYPDSNHNTKRVFKRGIVKGERENKEKAKEVLKMYNQIFNKNLSSIHSIESNLEFWLLEGYSLEDIRKAFEKAKEDDFWRNKITPQMLLRRKNPRGEDVDWIGQFLSAEKEGKDLFPGVKRV